MDEGVLGKIKNEMNPESLHNCIEEFDRVIFQTPQEFMLNEQLSHFSLQHGFDMEDEEDGNRG